MNSNLVSINVATASNIALNWLLAKIMHVDVSISTTAGTVQLLIASDAGSIPATYEPTTNPSQAYDIELRFQLATEKDDYSSGWICRRSGADDCERDYDCGPTPLIARARCVVASVFGDRTQVPDELSGAQLKPLASDIQDEIAYRLSVGQRRVSLEVFEDTIRQYGYRFDRRMDCKGPSRYMTGDRAGKSYPALSLKPVQIDDGLAWCNVEARRDSNFDALKASRETMFSLVNGRIAEW